ncbi:unnamed protein product [Lampetra planeri]
MAVSETLRQYRRDAEFDIWTCGVLTLTGVHTAALLILGVVGGGGFGPGSQEPRVLERGFPASCRAGGRCALPRGHYYGEQGGHRPTPTTIITATAAKHQHEERRRRRRHRQSRGAAAAAAGGSG